MPETDRFLYAIRTGARRFQPIHALPENAERNLSASGARSATIVAAGASPRSTAGCPLPLPTGNRRGPTGHDGQRDAPLRRLTVGAAAPLTCGTGLSTSAKHPYALLLKSRQICRSQRPRLKLSPLCLMIGNHSFRSSQGRRTSIRNPGNP